MGNENSRGQHRLISISSHWLSFITMGIVNLFAIHYVCFVEYRNPVSVISRDSSELQWFFFSLGVTFLTLGITDLLGHGSSRVWLT